MAEPASIYSINNLSAVSNPELPTAFFPANGQPALARTPTNFVTGQVLAVDGGLSQR